MDCIFENLNEGIKIKTDLSSCHKIYQKENVSFNCLGCLKTPLR